MYYILPAAAAKSLQSCLTLCNPIDGSPPGKNTGVGCHFLLRCMKVKSESEVAQSCPTPSDPIDCSLPGSSVHRILQARVLEWGAIDRSQLKSFSNQATLSTTGPTRSYGPCGRAARPNRLDLLESLILL